MSKYAFELSKKLAARVIAIAGLMGMVSLATLPVAASEQADFMALKNTGLVPGHQQVFMVDHQARDAALLKAGKPVDRSARPLLTISFDDGALARALLRPDRTLTKSRLKHTGGTARDADRALIGDFAFNE